MKITTRHLIRSRWAAFTFAAMVILLFYHSLIAATYRCDLDGKVVYHVEMGCCDIPNPLYDANGSYICSPDGGFTGTGDGSCPSGMVFCGCMEVDSSVVTELADAKCDYSMSTSEIRITRLVKSSYFPYCYAPQLTLLGESVPASLRNRELPLDEVLGLCGKMETLRIKPGNTYPCTLWTLAQGHCWPQRVRLVEPFSLNGLDTSRQWIYPDTAMPGSKIQLLFFDYRFNCHTQLSVTRISVQGGAVVINYGHADKWQCDGSDKYLYGLQVSLDSLKEGKYPVSVQDSGETQAHFIDTLYVIGRTSVKEPLRPLQGNGLRVTLNGQILRIDGLDRKSIRATAKIYGIDGTKLFEGTARPQNANGRSGTLLKVSNLPEGTYVIVVQEDGVQRRVRNLMYVHILGRK